MCSKLIASPQFRATKETIIGLYVLLKSGGEAEAILAALIPQLSEKRMRTLEFNKVACKVLRFPQYHDQMLSVVDAFCTKHTRKVKLLIGPIREFMLSLTEIGEHRTLATSLVQYSDEELTEHLNGLLGQET